MKTHSTAFASIIVMISALVTPLSVQSTPPMIQVDAQPVNLPPHPAPLHLTPPQQVIVGHAIAGDTSLPLRDIVEVASAPARATRPLLHPHALSAQTPDTSAAPEQTIHRANAVDSMPAPISSFEGISNQGPYVPADPNGAVGRTYYVQAVNMHFSIFNKTTGVRVYGPTAINMLWGGFGGGCQTNNDGDPIVLYDQLADRWIISQFAIVSDASGPYIQCVAISKTDDPTDVWNRYAFQMPAVSDFPNGKFNDYTKLAVWPNAYFMTMNEFANGFGTYTGVGVWALNRAQMLSGVITPTYVYIDVGASNSNYSSLLPANLDGTILPPPGSPGYFAAVDQASATNGWPSDALRIWQFNVDWTNPASATFGLASEPNAVLPVTSYTLVPCSGSNGTNCIPQPGTAPKVDAVGDRLMHRLVYRNFGDHQALVANHTVSAGSGVAGVRWYEIRDPGGNPSIFQQGTYSPDSVSRWMGSIAFDHDGNIAVGYSASSSSVYPSIRYAGRLASDPLGNLTQGEQSIITGTGSQSSLFARWGDYSAMSIDPTDDCTFWYTNQYYATTGISNWQTRIGAFKFPTCGSGWLTGTVTDLQSGLPITGAVVSTVNTVGTATFATTDASGLYVLRLFRNTYTVTASAYGYPPVGISDVSVTAGNTTTQNIALTKNNLFTVTGVVTDVVSGSPLSAQINVVGSPFNPPIQSTLTDASGTYTLTLAGGQAYTLTVTSSFKQTQMRGIGVLSIDRVENFALWRQLLLVIVLTP